MIKRIGARFGFKPCPEERAKKPPCFLPGVHKAVSKKHTETDIAGQKREYESKGSYSFSAYSDKTAIGTLVFPENLL